MREVIELGEERVVTAFSMEYILLTNSQDIEPILENDVDKSYDVIDYDNIGSLFVLMGEGEYREVWASTYSVPWNHLEYTRIA
jgi:hypothetical protein